MDLGISTNPTPELYTIKVTGEIDISNADSLRNAIDLALEQPTEAVELDFAQVSYIDSTGIACLVGAAHHAADHGKRFSCVNVQPPVMRVVQLLASTRRFRSPLHNLCPKRACRLAYVCDALGRFGVRALYLTE